MYFYGINTSQKRSIRSQPARLINFDFMQALLPKSVIETPFPQPRGIATRAAFSQAGPGGSACS